MTTAPDPGEASQGHERTPEEDAGSALFRLIRRWSRAATDDGADLVSPTRDAWVVEAVLLTSVRGDATATGVAAQLGVDRSVASRVIWRARERGLVDASPSPHDGRERHLRATSAGVAVLAGHRRRQEELFATATSGWTVAERDGFHRAVRRLLATTDGDPGPP